MFYLSSLKSHFVEVWHNNEDVFFPPTNLLCVDFWIWPPSVHTTTHLTLCPLSHTLAPSSSLSPSPSFKDTRNAFNIIQPIVCIRTRTPSPRQINKEARAAVVPKRARCFPLPACSLMTKASCCSCLLKPLLYGSIVDRAPLVYS